jgi:hypothetical protein
MATRDVPGMREALRALRRINDRLERKAIEVAISAGTARFLPDVKAKAPVDEGAYRDAIEAAPVRKRRGSFIGGVGLDRAKLYKATKGTRPRNLPELLEYGHALRYRDAEGRLVDNGTVAAKPHWRPAFEAHADESIDVIRDALMAFVVEVAHSAAIRENRLRRGLANARRSVDVNLQRAALAEARGDKAKAQAYREKAHKAEGRRLKYSRKLG